MVLKARFVGAGMRLTDFSADISRCSRRADSCGFRCFYRSPCCRSSCFFGCLDFSVCFGFS